MSHPHSPPTVVVLGGINMDLIGTAARLPAPGETIRGESFYTTPGGKGANQAVAAARLGARVRMVGRVGDDVFGPMLLDALRSDGVDVEGVAVDPSHPSGVAMILLDSQKENYIVAVYGANMECDDDQVRAVESALGGADALLLQLEVPYEVSLAAARAAQEASVRVIWDPAPASDLPPEAYRAMDVVTPNQVEAEALTGIEVRDIQSARAAAEELLSRGPAAAVVKMGELGAYYCSREESGHVPAFAVEAIDTVAGGDAFAAGLAVSLAEGSELVRSVLYASAAGALAVTRLGAQDAMPERGEVETLVARL